MTRKRIAQAFGRAAEGYDDAARVQLVTARLLRDRLQDAVTPNSGATRILEIGSGTGLMTLQLASLFPNAELTVTDLSPEMLVRCREKLQRSFPGRTLQYLAMDGECLALSGHYDLICSSFCIQWFKDRQASFRALGRLLSPGGVLAVSTLADGSFKEWHRACDASELPRSFVGWPALDILKKEFPAGGHAEWSLHDLSDPVGSAKQFLAGIRDIGALTAPDARRPLQSGALRRIMESFDAVSHHMSYRVAIGIYTHHEGAAA